MLAVVEEGFKSKEEILKQIEHIHWYKMANQNALQVYYSELPPILH